MTEQYDKPFLTYDEMLQLMVSRNLTIPDVDFAKQSLSNYSYYTLVNGYKNSHIMVPNSDNFVTGITFDHLYTLHFLDLSIHHILLKYILIIESSLKSHISYVVSRDFGIFSDLTDRSNLNPKDYLYRDNYQNSRKRNNTLKILKGRLIDSSKSESLNYYRNHHNHIPPWILTTALSFGNCIMWFASLKPAQKEYVCECFIPINLPVNDKKDYLLSALEFLCQFRNKIAHGSRTFSLEINHCIPRKLFLQLSGGILNESEVKKSKYKNGLLGAISIILSLLNDKYMIASMMSDLYNVLSPYCSEEQKINGSTILELFSLPDDLFRRFGI